MILVISMLFMGNQIKDERVANERAFTGDNPSKSIQVLILKISIDDYASMTELLISEMELKLYFNKNPYKVVK